MVAGGFVFKLSSIGPNSRDILFVADELADEELELFVGDRCIFCNTFDSGNTTRWSQSVP